MYRFFCAMRDLLHALIALEVDKKLLQVVNLLVFFVFVFLKDSLQGCMHTYTQTQY